MAQRSRCRSGATWASHPRARPGDCEARAAGSPPREPLLSAEGGRHRSLAPLLGPPAAPRRPAAERGPLWRCPAPACRGRSSENTKVSGPNSSSPSPPKSGLRIRGARTPLASTPPQAGHVQKPAAPATGPGQRGKLTAVANGLGAQLAGFLPRSPGGEATKWTSRPRGAAATARAKGLPSRGEDRARGAGSGRLPWRLASASRCPRRSPCAARGATPGARLGGGRARLPAPRGGGCALGEELGRARAGGRLASGPVCAPRAASPAARAECARPRRAGYKRGGAGRGERARRPRVTPRGGGRKRREAAGRGGGERRRGACRGS